MKLYCSQFLVGIVNLLETIEAKNNLDLKKVKQKPNSIVDLNVFAWNNNAISCYKNLGFKENKSKNSTYNFKGNNWEVINMEIKLPITHV